MNTPSAKPPSSKSNRAWKKLVGTMVVAGAAIAAEKIIESRLRRPTTKKKAI